MNILNWLLGRNKRNKRKKRNEEYEATPLDNVKKAIEYYLSHNQAYQVLFDGLNLTSQDLTDLMPLLIEANKKKPIKHLILKNNKIETFGSFECLPELEVLSLNNNNIKNIGPNAFGNLPNLEMLSLKNNKITKIEPNAFSNLPELSDIDLDNNQITEVQNGTFNDLPKLSLYLARNNIRDIGAGLNNLPNLESINLHSNGITSVQGGLNNLLNLKHIYLGDNGITSLEGGLNNLPNLEILNISYNNIEHFPNNAFNQSKKLKKVIAYNNRITLVPESLYGINSIFTIDLSDNPLTEETIRYLVQTYGNRAVYNMAAFDRCINYDDVLRVIYQDKIPNNITEIIKSREEIECVNNSEIPINHKIKKLKFNIIKEFLEKISASPLFVDKGLLEAIVKPTVIKLFSELDDNTIQSINQSLGDCATPVTKFLLERFVGDNQNSSINKKLVEDMIVYLALFDHISLNKNFEFDENERIEAVNGLFNIICLPGRDDDENNPIKGLKSPYNIDSMTTYIRFAFKLVAGNKALLSQFKKEFCIKDNNNFVLNQDKIKKIIDNYKHKNLGIIEAEQLDNLKYIKEIEKSSLYQYICSEHIDDKRVQDIIKMVAESQKAAEINEKIAAFKASKDITEAKIEKELKECRELIKEQSFYKYMVKNYSDHKIVSSIITIVNGPLGYNEDNQINEKIDTFRKQEKKIYEDYEDYKTQINKNNTNEAKINKLKDDMFYKYMCANYRNYENPEKAINIMNMVSNNKPYESIDKEYNQYIVLQPKVITDACAAHDKEQKNKIKEDPFYQYIRLDTKLRSNYDVKKITNMVNDSKSSYEDIIGKINIFKKNNPKIVKSFESTQAAGEEHLFGSNGSNPGTSQSFGTPPNARRQTRRPVDNDFGDTSNDPSNHERSGDGDGRVLGNIGPIM